MFGDPRTVTFILETVLVGTCGLVFPGKIRVTESFRPRPLSPHSVLLPTLSPGGSGPLGPFRGSVTGRAQEGLRLKGTGPGRPHTVRSSRNEGVQEDGTLTPPGIVSRSSSREVKSPIPLRSPGKTLDVLFLFLQFPILVLLEKGVSRPPRTSGGILGSG